MSESKKQHLRQLATLDDEALKLLAELSKKPGAGKKLKDNAFILKSFV